MTDPSSGLIPAYPLLPWPQTLTPGEGVLDVGGGLAVEIPQAYPLLSHLACAGDVPVAISIERKAEQRPLPGDDESYRLTIDADGVQLSAATQWGVLRGMATLDQLNVGGHLPVCTIEDAPRFAWRGVMLDPARRFLSVAALKTTIDGMAAVKLNVLHLHLSDDQGFRFPSAAFPKLASEEHYTREELEELVAYAAARGVRIVPELDMPGHVTSWITAYPEWGCQPAEPTDRFGVHSACLNPAKEEVFEAIATLLSEVAEVFPDPYLHVGGDEVNGRQWAEDADVQALMASHDLDDTAKVQAWFNHRVATIARELGKGIVAWDEVLNGVAPAGTLIQAWRGSTAIDRALGAGHHCIVSSAWYLDLFYPADVHHQFDPLASADERVAYEERLFEDPRFAHVAEGMAWTRHWREVAEGPPGASQVLGGEACLWNELVDEAVLKPRLWSRLPAIADRLWAPAEVVDEAGFYARLSATHASLARGGVTDIHAESDALLRRAGVTDAQLPLVRLLEPVKWYARLLGETALRARLEGTEMPQARPYRVSTPLDKPVDGLLPESLAGREFAASLAQLSDAEVRALMASWQAAAATNDWPADLQPVAATFGRVARAVVGALDGDPADALSELDSASQPIGEYLIAVVPALAAWLRSR